MSEVLVDGAFSAQLSSGFADLTTPMAAMSDIQVDGAASESLNTASNALQRLL